MNTIIEKQINEMTDNELKEVLRRDYLRKLTRYKMTDNFYRKNNLNPTKIDIYRQLETEFIDTKHEINKESLTLYKDSLGINYWRFWNDFVCYRTSRREFESCKVLMEFGLNNKNKITSILEKNIKNLKFTKNRPQ